MRAIALRHDITRTAFATATLRGNTQFNLDVVKIHPGTRVARDFTVGDAAADADNHEVLDVLNECMSINANPSHLQ